MDSLVVEHIQVNAAPKMRRRTYRAHGRINRKSGTFVPSVLLLQFLYDNFPLPSNSKQTVKFYENSIARFSCHS